MGRFSLAMLVLLVAGCASESDGPPVPLPPSGPRAGLFISPMGEPFRAEGSGADLIGRWFDGADADHDGVLTEAEMTRDAARFFRTLDIDNNGELTPPEMVRYETEVAPEIQLSRQSGPRGGPGAGRSSAQARPEAAPPGGPPAEPATNRPREDRRGPPLPEGASRYALLDLPQPVAAADVDINRAVTAEEFEAAAVERFQRLDRDHDGRITRQELEPLPLPAKK